MSGVSKPSFSSSVRSVSLATVGTFALTLVAFGALASLRFQFSYLNQYKCLTRINAFYSGVLLGVGVQGVSLVACDFFHTSQVKQRVAPKQQKAFVSVSEEKKRLVSAPLSTSPDPLRIHYVLKALSELKKLCESYQRRLVEVYVTEESWDKAAMTSFCEGFPSVKVFQLAKEGPENFHFRDAFSGEEKIVSKKEFISSVEYLGESDE